MLNIDTSERGFQNHIIEELTTKEGYILTKSADFDKEFCLNQSEFKTFLKATQPEIFEMMESKGDRHFFARLDGEIKKHGIIQVMRKGVKHAKYANKTVKLFYTQPVHAHNPKDQARWEANRFSVSEELKYTESNENRIDLVLSINGFPVVTMELKNAYTHQSYQNAIRQYKTTRSNRDTIFNFSRCLVHLAVDSDEAWFTTALSGQKTVFMPFNKGQNDGLPFPPFGKGNPPNPAGIKTDYLWKEVFTRESLANIIEKFAQVLPDKKVQIFPRYHQLMAVRKLLADVKEKGVGNRYLIQHSAGSGKSNSITWLAHQLVGMHQNGEDSPVFDSIIVVTDRKNLDEQIRDNIKAFSQVDQVVEAITGDAKAIKRFNPAETQFSKTIHMSYALQNNKKILICTVQTFPFVLKAMEGMQKKNVAIIIDEAHSSQSGEASASMNALFMDKEALELPKDEEGNVSTEDLLNHIVESKRMLKNASYFAFTATPKNKTIETFGNQYEDGKFYPFHTYSMKQAIEEEFILDVLKNYTTYKSYYKLAKSGEDNPMFETKEANKKLRAFVEGLDMAIQDKSKIMIDHFHSEVKHLIQGEAKAMVVTKSIESAIRYKDAFDRYLKEINSPYKAIVAFSGKKKHYKTGEEVTEESMNAFSDGNDIPKQFKKSEYRFLVVADKYQTGFDEPLLHTMYVDKKLCDVQAVQTLSRLNRCKKPHKKDTFVIDFFNTTEEIQMSFEPFYTTTILSEETDVNKLNDLEGALDDAQVYSQHDIDTFVELSIAGASKAKWEPILDRAVDVFENQLNKEQQINFKGNAKTFIRTYAYLVRILDFTSTEWEKLFIYLKPLATKLHIETGDDSEADIREYVDIDRYMSNREHDKANISLSGEDNEIYPIPVSQVSGVSEKRYDTLEQILSDFNERFGDIGEWATDPEKAKEVLSKEIPEAMKQQEETINAMKNSDRQNAKIAVDKNLSNLTNNLMFTHTEIFKKLNDDPSFKARYQDFVFETLMKSLS